MLSADIVQCGDTEYVCVVSLVGADDGARDVFIRLWSLNEGQAKPLSTSNLTASVRNTDVHNSYNVS